MKQKEWEAGQKKRFRQTLKKTPILWEVQERYIVRHSDMTAADEMYLNVFAPVAIVFVEWIITQAVNSGKKRLYFLARDSYPMYITALKLCEKRHIDLDIRLLSVSRYALRMPEYHIIKEKAADRIVIGGIDITLRKILKRAGLSEAEEACVVKVLEMEGQADRILNYNQVMELKEQLKDCGIFLEYVYEHSKAAYAAAAGYLEQEGMLDDVSYALVDSGWTGTLLQTITNLIRVKKPDFVTEGYYFGLYELPREADEKSYHSFYFSPKSGLKRKVYFSNCLFEAVFSMDCGMTLGYDLEGDKYVPVKSPKGNPNSLMLNRNLELLREYVDIYSELTENMSKEENERLLKKNTVGCSRLLMDFMGKPDYMAAQIYGSSLFCDDVLEGGLMMVAREMTVGEIKNQRLIRRLAVMSGIKEGELHDSAWLEGSIARAGGAVRLNLIHARIYKYALYLRKRLKIFQEK